MAKSKPSKPAEKQTKVESDSDVRIFNQATQPLGSMASVKLGAATRIKAA